MTDGLTEFYSTPIPPADCGYNGGCTRRDDHHHAKVCLTRDGNPKVTVSHHWMSQFEHWWLSYHHLYPRSTAAAQRRAAELDEGTYGIRN